MAPREKKGRKRVPPERKSWSKVEPTPSESDQGGKGSGPTQNTLKGKNKNDKKSQKGNSFVQKAKVHLKRILSRQMLSDVIFNPYYFSFAACAFLVLEAVLNVLIIENVKYTEIDWVAYMQEVGGFLNGTLDYSKLRGDTGPLVYPAGFVYIFSLFYLVTDAGRNIYLAQYLFAAIYLLNLALVFRIYHKSKKVPPYLLLFVCLLSHRVHSLFVLRLFNDPVAVLLIHAAINCFISGRWNAGSILFSLAVSVKMNILLYAPALLMTFLYCLGLAGTVLQLALCLAVQVLLGLPFLVSNPWAYLSGAFNLGRVFLFEWSVNWRFLPESLFLNPFFHVALLAAHVAALALFAYTHWTRYLPHYASLRSSSPQLEVSCQLVLLPLFASNFVGVAFARSLHFQFYVWYFHSLPYLLWCTTLAVPSRLLVLGLLELCWNTFPPTWWSSLLLHACHAIILGALLLNRPSQERVQAVRKRLLGKEP